MKHRYQINRYCKLLNKQKHIVGCWKGDSDRILLTHCKYKSIIWIYRWTRWATRLLPARFRWVGSLPWNRTRVGSLDVLTTQTANLATVRFGLDPDPDPKCLSGTVANTTHWNKELSWSVEYATDQPGHHQSSYEQTRHPSRVPCLPA